MCRFQTHSPCSFGPFQLVHMHDNPSKRWNPCMKFVRIPADMTNGSWESPHRDELCTLKLSPQRSPSPCPLSMKNFPIHQFVYKASPCFSVKPMIELACHFHLARPAQSLRRFSVHDPSFTRRRAVWMLTGAVSSSNHYEHQSRKHGSRKFSIVSRIQTCYHGSHSDMLL